MNPDITSNESIGNNSVISKVSIIPNQVHSSIATAIYNLVNEGRVTLKLVSLSGNPVYKQDLGSQGSGDHNYLLRNFLHISQDYPIESGWRGDEPGP